MSSIIKLDLNTPSVQYLCKKDKRLGKVIEMVGPISYSPHEDGFSFLIHEIIEQMLSIKAAQKIYNRLEDLCSGNVTAESLNVLSKDEIKSTGTSGPKASYIKNLTTAVISGDLILSDLDTLSNVDVIKKLTSIKGIGIWTAKMYLMFVLDRPDILPLEDGAWLQTYRWLYKTQDCSAQAIHKKCKKWKPYSSVASRFFYRALDMGYTREEFHLFK